MVKYLLFYYGVVAVAASLTSKQEVQVYYFKKPSKSRNDFKLIPLWLHIPILKKFCFHCLLDQLVTKYQLLKFFVTFLLLSQFEKKKGQPGLFFFELWEQQQQKVNFIFIYWLMQWKSKSLNILKPYLFPHPNPINVIISWIISL